MGSGLSLTERVSKGCLVQLNDIKKWKVNGREVPLFKIRQVGRAVGFSNEAIRKKEDRNMIPKPLFWSESSRLYSIEEIAMFEYLFKVVWPKRQGVKVPPETIELFHRVFNAVREKVIEKGRVYEEDLYPISEEFSSFDAYVAYSYIKHWRTVLLGEEDEIGDELSDIFSDW